MAAQRVWSWTTYQGLGISGDRLTIHAPDEVLDCIGDQAPYRVTIEQLFDNHMDELEDENRDLRLKIIELEREIAKHAARPAGETDGA